MPSFCSLLVVVNFRLLCWVLFGLCGRPAHMYMGIFRNGVGCPNTPPPPSRQRRGGQTIIDLRTAGNSEDACTTLLLCAAPGMHAGPTSKQACPPDMPSHTWLGHSERASFYISILFPYTNETFGLQKTSWEKGPRRGLLMESVDWSNFDGVSRTRFSLPLSSWLV